MSDSGQVSAGGGENLDKVGAVASTLCAIHCAVCALLPAAFGALGVGFLLGQEAEWIFTLIAVAFAGAALFFGWRKHRSNAVMAVLVLGIVGLLASRVIEGAGGHDHHHHGAHGEEGHGAHHGEGDGHHGEGEEKHHGEGEKGHAEGKEHHGEGEKHHGKGDKHHDEGHEKHGRVHRNTDDGESADGHGDGELTHMAGAGVGIVGGLLLLTGHIMNLRALRRRKEEECC